MEVEIERKCHLSNSDWEEQVDKSVYVQQGYICSHKERTVRGRVPMAKHGNRDGDTTAHFRSF